jgi:hypothetical protein
MDRLEFDALYPAPFLLIRIPDVAGDEEPRTRTLLPGELDGPLHEDDTVLVVAQVRDSKRNDFEHMVTIGRTENNDIVIPHPCISKFQAYLGVGTGRVTITDGGSLNGTEVEGRAFSPMRGVELRSGERVTFSKTVTALFLTPGDMWAHLRSRMVYGHPMDH